MGNSLLTGVSGLIAHQRLLEVVGNNLANINTTGFKSQRTVFSDLLYQTIRPAANTSSGDVGGTNPNQIGSGVKIAQISHKFSQGNLEPTGGLFDYALQGDGFFMVNDGQKDYYTRAGSFALDAFNQLVDPATGFRVQRFGDVGEPDGVNPGFQVPGDNGIVVPLGSSIPGQVTSSLSLVGNLSAQATGPKAEVLISASPFEVGGSAASLTTLLNDLDSNVVDHTAGDSLTISGSDADGTAINTTLAVSGATTLGDLISALDSAFAGASVSLDALGNLRVTADNVGEAFLGLSIVDSTGNAGFTNYTNHASEVLTEGKAGDNFETAIEVFDVRGNAHKVNLSFVKQGNDVWDLTASLPATEGTVIDGSVQQIQFSEDGSLQQVFGTGLGDSNLILQFNGVTAPQSINVSFGQNGTFDALTHLALDSSVASEQDGFAPGTLVGVNISADGILEGVATNGRKFPVAQLAIAMFANSNGLLGEGENYFSTSINSGATQIGAAGSGGRGSIAGGQLEQSNVDIAFEFTKLIVAQRGFSANARTITVSDRVLEELTNLIR